MAQVTPEGVISGNFEWFETGYNSIAF